jgi:hypothetical protein
MKTTEKRAHIAAARSKHHRALEQLAQSLNPEFSGNGLNLWRKLNRIEREAHAGATAYCNGEKFTVHHRTASKTYDFGHEENAWEFFANFITSQVVKVFGGLPPSFTVNGDARGYALKLASNDSGTRHATPFDLHTDWGSNQILAPTIE